MSCPIMQSHAQTAVVYTFALRNGIHVKLKDITKKFIWGDSVGNNNKWGLLIWSPKGDNAVCSKPPVLR